jgi:ketosteroid isomerase-like protein
MRQLKWLAAVVLICGCGVVRGAVHGPAPVGMASEQQAQAAVMHLEREWLEALNRADVKTIAGILADDFVRPAPQSGQFIGKADLLRYYRSHLVPLKAETKQIENMTVTVYGNSAIARGQVVARDAKGVTSSTLLFTDVFLRRAGRWQAVSAQENPVPGH